MRSAQSTSRRAFLRVIGLGAAAATGATLLAACTNSAPASTSPAAGPTSAAAAKPTAAPAAAAAPTAANAAAATAATPTAAPTPVAPVATVAPTNLGKNFNNQQIKIGASTEYYAYALRQFQGQIEKELGVKINIDVVPSGDMYQRNLTEFTSGSTSYDLFMFLPFQLPDYAAHLEPLDDLSKTYGFDLKLDDVLPVFREVYSTWGGKIVSMPFDGDVHLFLYNKDAFGSTDLQNKFKSKYGYDLKAPDTYDQYLDMAQFFTENNWRTDGGGQGFGTAEGLGGPEWWWENRFGSYGAVYFDDDVKPLINSKNALAATDNLVKAAKFMPPGANTFGYQEVENALVKGDVAMSINWSSAFRTSTNPQKSTTVGKIGTAMTPGAMVNGKLVRHDALCTGWSLGIPKYTKNKEPAAYVLWFYSQPEVHLQFIIDPDTGVDAFRTSVLDNDRFVSKYGKDYAQTIKDALAAGFPDLQMLNSQEYYQRLDDGLKEAIVGSKTVQAALDDAASRWSDITQRMGQSRQKDAWSKESANMKARGIEYIAMS